MFSAAVTSPFAEGGDRVECFVAAEDAIGEQMSRLGKRKAFASSRGSTLCRRPVRCGFATKRASTVHCLSVADSVCR
jgi:hypothetical protein